MHVAGDYSESALEAMRIRHDFQGMPLIVLTSGTTEDARLAGYSWAGQSVAVPDSGHYIQLDQPQGRHRRRPFRRRSGA